MFCKILNRLLHCTLSKAFSKSTNAINMFLFLLICLSINILSVMIASLVSIFFLNTNWSLSRFSSIALFRIVLRTPYLSYVYTVLSNSFSTSQFLAQFSLVFHYYCFLLKFLQRIFSQEKLFHFHICQVTSSSF